MDTECTLPRPPSPEEGRIGLQSVFASAAVEDAFRRQHFRDDLWLCGFLVSAGMLRVALFLLADYLHLGLGPLFWLLCAGRLVFLLASAWVLVALRRAAGPAAADRLFLGWGFLLFAMTTLALSARPPDNTVLLLMSFGTIFIIYGLAPLPLPRQAVLALSYSAAILWASRRADGDVFAMVGATHVLSNLFGAITSWRLNRRRREMFLGGLREAGLRAHLEAALAEVRTLRGMLCICAWCKRVRDEAEAWESVELYVQNRTHASFSHGICPECMQAQLAELAQLRS